MIILSPFIYPAGIVIIMLLGGVILSLIKSNSILYQKLSLAYSFGGVVFYYILIDPSFYEDYLNYVSWLHRAIEIESSHIDFLFARVMSILSSISVNGLFFKTFVLTIFLLFLLIIKKISNLNIAVFSALLINNPRVLELIFNSTRASLAIMAFTLAIFFLFKKNIFLSLFFIIISIGTHLYITIIGVIGLIVSRFLPSSFLLFISIIFTLTYTIGINTSANMDWLFDPLLFIVNSQRYGAENEYLSMDITSSLIGRISMIFFIALPVYFAHYLSIKNSFLISFSRISLTYLSIMLFWAHAFPVVLRIGLLIILISNYIISQNINTKNNIYFAYYFIYCSVGMYLIYKNALFISF